MGTPDELHQGKRIDDNAVIAVKVIAASGVYGIYWSLAKGVQPTRRCGAPFASARYRYVCATWSSRRVGRDLVDAGYRRLRGRG